jgi:hypothetical protein
METLVSGLALIGAMVVVMLVLVTLGYVWDKVPLMFPEWRAARSRSRFEKGANWARETLQGKSDKFITLRRGQPESEVSEADRLRYIDSLLEEASFFNRNKTPDQFDSGARSVYYPLYIELKDDELL